MLIAIDANALLRPNPTGVENYARELIVHMMQQSNDADVVLYGAADCPSWLILPARWSWKTLKFFLPKGWTHVRLSWELLIHPPDVFFSPAHEIPLYVSSKTKIVTTIHDVAFLHFPEGYAPMHLKRARLATARALRLASRVVCVSQTTCNDIQSMSTASGIVTPLAPLWTTPPSAEAQAETLRRYGLTQGQYVISVSRIETKKNQLTLVRAFSALKTELGLGHPLRLVLVGGLGVGGEDVVRAVNESPHSKDILLPGYLPDADTQALVAGSLCFAFPSLAEGFGIPVADAATFGVPIIASDLPVFREIVGENGAYYVSSRDSTAWKNALRQILFDADLRQRLVESAATEVKKLSWSETARKTWDALLMS